MNTKCNVKFCKEKKAWRLYNSNGESVDGMCYDTKEEAAASRARFKAAHPNNSDYQKAWLLYNK